MQTAGVQLLNNGSGTGTTYPWPGGRGWFAVKATFGGGNVALQYLLPDGATYVNAISAISADGGAAFELPPCRIRAVATTATAVYARADRIPA